MKPIEIVTKRMQAYNQHNLTDFLATYAEAIEIYTYPNTLLGKGKAHLKNLFEAMFTAQAVHVTIHQQIAKGNCVINHETVSYEGADTDYVSIYEIKDELIQTVRFVRD